MHQQTALNAEMMTNGVNSIHESVASREVHKRDVDVKLIMMWVRLFIVDRVSQN